MSENWIHEFRPDAGDFFRILCPQINDNILREIATADYAQDIERHLAPLKLFRDTHNIPKRLTRNRQLKSGNASDASDIHLPRNRPTYPDFLAAAASFNAR